MTSVTIPKYSPSFYLQMTRIFFHSSNHLTEAIDVVNRQLSKVSDWLQCNKLSVNVSKTKCMLFSYGKIARDVTIYLNGSQIEQIETCKFLGVVIDSKLSWKQHCQKVQISLSRNLVL